MQNAGEMEDFEAAKREVTNEIYGPDFLESECMRMSKSIAKELTALLLFLSMLILMTATASPVSSQEDSSSRELPEGAEYLPPGHARKLILEGCVQCHNLVNSVSQRKTRTAWRRTVNEMIWRGAPLTADEAEIITNYLAASFGPDQPVPEALRTRPAKR